MECEQYLQANVENVSLCIWNALDETCMQEEVLTSRNVLKHSSTLEARRSEPIAMENTSNRFRDFLLNTKIAVKNVELFTTVTVS